MKCYRCSIIGLESEDWECKGGQHIRNLERKEENWNFVIVVEDGRGSSDPDYILYWALLERRAASVQSRSNGVAYCEEEMRENFRCLINKL